MCKTFYLVFHLNLQEKRFRTYISTQSNSWLDDFSDWGDTTKCCKYFESNSSFCPHTYTNEICASCDLATVNMDKSNYYLKYLPYFLMDNPDSTCAKGGHASYYQVRPVNEIIEY